MVTMWPVVAMAALVGKFPVVKSPVTAALMFDFTPLSAASRNTVRTWSGLLNCSKSRTT